MNEQLNRISHAKDACRQAFERLVRLENCVQAGMDYQANQERIGAQEAIQDALYELTTARLVIDTPEVIAGTRDALDALGVRK